jgi:hypothetical protein
MHLRGPTPARLPRSAAPDIVETANVPTSLLNQVVASRAVAFRDSRGDVQGESVPRCLIAPAAGLTAAAKAARLP